MEKVVNTEDVCDRLSFYMTKGDLLTQPSGGLPSVAEDDVTGSPSLGRLGASYTELWTGSLDCRGTGSVLASVCEPLR